MRRRAEEQRAAAAVGGYDALVQLGLPTAVVRDPTDPTVVDALVDVLERTRPATLYTHDPTDPHDTHVAVFCAVVAALRRCDPAARPRQLLACEVWRGLDWTTGDDRIVADCSGDEELADALIRAHASQLAGTARFDLAAAGRRRAHAVFAAPGAGATAVSLALDCTPLVTDPTLDPVHFVTGAVERFRDEVAGRLRAARR